MLETFKELIANQFAAALCTLNMCVNKCPEDMWNARIANYAFCQVAFHTLFYADYYLGQDETSFRQQDFHRDNKQFFGDYEEFEDRAPQSLYDKETIKEYIQHCRKKALAAIAAETVESLKARTGFARLAFSRAELYVYKIRHIQHHAAHLGLRLRIDAHENISWVKSGWSSP